MRGDLLNGSAVKHILAASPGDFNSPGSSLPYNLGGYTHGKLVVAAGSINSGFEAHVQRSGTSDGTYQPFGASIALGTGSQMAVRNFTMDSSAVWHRVYVDNGTGSANVGVVLEAQGTYFAPIEQAASVTVHSDVTGG